MHHPRSVPSKAEAINVSGVEEGYSRRPTEGQVGKTPSHPAYGTYAINCVGTNIILFGIFHDNMSLL